MAEAIACIVRVPSEVIKQRRQVFMDPSTSKTAVHIYTTLGPKGFYQGFTATLLRELPFTCIQFPVYENFKALFTSFFSRNPTPIEAAVCGSLAGGIAAAITTPLDVLKTRTMIAQPPDDSLVLIARALLKAPSKLFSGICPRVAWITLGGGIFFGAYEAALLVLG